MSNKDESTEKLPLPETERVRCSEYLKRVLTREEREGFSSDLAQKLTQIDELKMNKKRVVKACDSDIATAEAEVKKLTSLVHDGFEFRNIDCECVYDFTTKSKTIIRLDTGEKVREIAMSAAELQQKLNLEPKEGTSHGN